MKLWRPFKEFPPVVKAAAFMVPASLTIFLNQWLYPAEADTREVLAYYYRVELRSFENCFNFIYLIPLKEEALYRWPSLALLYTLLLLIKRYAHEPARKLKIAAYSLSSALMVGMAAYWASMHDYPIPVFCYGLVWGWLMLHTKNPLYSWFFHSVCNLASIGLIAAGYHLVY